MLLSAWPSDRCLADGHSLSPACLEDILGRRRRSAGLTVYLGSPKLELLCDSSHATQAGAAQRGLWQQALLVAVATGNPWPSAEFAPDAKQTVLVCMGWPRPNS